MGEQVRLITSCTSCNNAIFVGLASPTIDPNAYFCVGGRCPTPNGKAIKLGAVAYSGASAVRVSVEDRNQRREQHWSHRALFVAPLHELSNGARYQPIQISCRRQLAPLHPCIYAVIFRSEIIKKM